MRYLWPCGTYDDRFYGVIVTPATWGIPQAVRDGRPWMADNQAFTQGFDPRKYFSWLVTLLQWQENCIGCVVPDKVGNALQTLAWFKAWAPEFINRGWPTAFAAQDGQELFGLPDPTTWQTLFVGGTTEWKESPAAIQVIKRAQALGKRIHIGRVNAWRRYSLFRQIRGSEHFTCDGTRPRYDGVDPAKEAWLECERRLTLELF